MRFLSKCTFAVIFLLSLATSPAVSQVQPSTTAANEALHQGIMGCYGSTCHSRQEATGVVVRQNEILSWQDQTSTTGAHLRAYKILLSERSSAITQRLNLGKPEEEPSCLGCHSDNVAENLRGPKFQVDDGIGCEACHGGSVNWLTQHYDVGASHTKNVSLGLTPLEDAGSRADVCLSCHLGSADNNQFVTHRMMAAGHPRISFELDLFTSLQSHHDEDVDYFERKVVQPGVRIWAIGQAKAMKRNLALFQTPTLNRDGVFPELVFFDCLACHREISDDPDWRPEVRSNPGRPEAPGVVKFNDANMIMLLATAKQIAPEIAPKIDTEIKAFHASLAGGGRDASEVSQSLEGLAEDLMKVVTETDFSKNQTLGILEVVVEDALTRRYTDYVAAEQAIMAVDTLLSSMVAANQVSFAQTSGMRNEINKAYDAVESPNDYDQDQLTTALEVLRGRLKELRSDAG